MSATVSRELVRRLGVTNGLPALELGIAVVSGELAPTQVGRCP